jgi:subtilisin family serine protease
LYQNGISSQDSSVILRDESTEDWFSNNEKLKRVHSCVAAVRKLGKRIKIAILDSGIDSRHTEMAQNIVKPCPVNCAMETKAKIKSENNSRAIKKWQGFPYTLDPCQDRRGHGTHIASVIFKTAPYAALYIGRIFSDGGQMCELDELVKVQI